MSIHVRIRNGMSEAREEDLLGLSTDILAAAGVVDLAGGDLLVEQQASPDMTVKVAKGVGYVLNASYAANIDDQTRFWQVLNDASANLTIGANSSGSTRYDLICVKIDTLAVPDAEASNVGSLVVVVGTPGAGVPATPSNYLKIAEIEVINGATSIPTAKITDSRVQIAINSRNIPTTLLQKTLDTPLFKGTIDGWIDANENWAYASATTITVPSGATSKYAVGDRIRLVQSSTTKYFYVIGVASTVLTITGGSSYTLANSAITANYYSHAISLVGFPKSMAFTIASWATSGTAFTNAPAVAQAFFSIVGGFCYVWLEIVTNATSGGTGIFKATPTTGHLPAAAAAGFFAGPVINVNDTTKSGVIYWGTATALWIQKYDGTAIAANSAYVDSTIGFYF